MVRFIGFVVPDNVVDVKLVPLATVMITVRLTPEVLLNVKVPKAVAGTPVKSVVAFETVNVMLSPATGGPAGDQVMPDQATDPAANVAV
jgi:hypothetical protein